MRFMKILDVSVRITRLDMKVMILILKEYQNNSIEMP